MRVRDVAAGRTWATVARKRGEVKAGGDRRAHAWVVGERLHLRKLGRDPKLTLISISTATGGQAAPRPAPV